MGDLFFGRSRLLMTWNSSIYLGMIWIRVLLMCHSFMCICSFKESGELPPVMPGKSKHKLTPPFASLLGERHLPSKRAPLDMPQQPHAGVYEAILAVLNLGMPFLLHSTMKFHSSFTLKRDRRGCSHLPGEAGQATWAHPTVNFYIIYSINLFI